MIIECQFQFAHGYAFITNGFGGPAQTLAQGYIALVIPKGLDRERPAGVWHYDGSDFISDVFGERLDQ